MGTLIQFPQDRRVERAGTRVDMGESAVVLVLPVIRIERAPDHPGGEPDADSAAGRKRRRRSPRG
jgi:hypothetical protein